MRQVPGQASMASTIACVTRAYTSERGEADMICSPFSRRGPSPAAEARSRRAQGGSRTRQGRSEAKDGEAVARDRRPEPDAANSRGGLRRGRIDPGKHRGDRKSVLMGTGVSVRVDIMGSVELKTKKR